MFSWRLLTFRALFHLQLFLLDFKVNRRLRAGRSRACQRRTETLFCLLSWVWGELEELRLLIYGRDAAVLWISAVSCSAFLTCGPYFCASVHFIKHPGDMKFGIYRFILQSEFWGWEQIYWSHNNDPRVKSFFLLVSECVWILWQGQRALTNCICWFIIVTSLAHAFSLCVFQEAVLCLSSSPMIWWSWPGSPWPCRAPSPGITEWCFGSKTDSLWASIEICPVREKSSAALFVG